ncbi:unnamed protein product [Trichogramma brassicae]|uniref:Uncharacterized protein n=1 Tax=Trichogramma brassicae TaxID=86971 RepID=A0A6H5IR79_9HYME|nr:unnamed protein product [Trichogramma brassicae]
MVFDRVVPTSLSFFRQHLCMPDHFFHFKMMPKTQKHFKRNISTSLPHNLSTRCFRARDRKTLINGRQDGPKAAEPAAAHQQLHGRIHFFVRHTNGRTLSTMVWAQGAKSNLNLYIRSKSQYLAKVILRRENEAIHIHNPRVYRPHLVKDSLQPVVVVSDPFCHGIELYRLLNVVVNLKE